MKKKVTSVVWKEGKFYVARALNVEVSSFGATKREALQQLREALDFILMVLLALCSTIVLQLDYGK